MARWRRDHLVVDVGLGDLLLDLLHAGQQAHQALHAAHASPSAPAGRRGRRGRTGPWPASWPCCSALAWSSSAAAFSTSATTSPWPRMRPATRRASNTSSASIRSPVAEELDRQAGDRAHGERRAAAGVAVGAGEDQAGQRQALVERLGGAHRVLAGQAVGDQQGLGRRGDAGDLGRLAHHRLVERGAAGGVEDERRRSRRAARPRARGGRCRARPGRATIGRLSTSACLARIASCSMAAGRRVSSEAISTLLRSVLASRSASLADMVVLPEPCRPAIRITVGGLSARLQRLGLLAAQHLDQAVVDDLDHLVGRPDRADHRLAGGRAPWPWR